MLHFAPVADSGGCVRHDGVGESATLLGEERVAAAEPFSYSFSISFSVGEKKKKNMIMKKALPAWAVLCKTVRGARVTALAQMGIHSHSSPLE
jgi:hypothetical protein